MGVPTLENPNMWGPRDKVYGTEFYEETTADSLAAAKLIVPVLLETVRPQGVVDFGCGEGAWLSVFAAHGVNDLLGLDGAYANTERALIAAERFRALDLERLQPLDRRFDLALCLEVAEHLTPSAGETLIEVLTKAAPVVIFSAAVPGQGGTHHVNEQYLDYWVERFGRYGFLALDVIRPRVAYDHRVAWWYRQNLMLFASADRAPEIASKIGIKLGRVSQEWIHMHSLVGVLTLRQTLRRLPRAALRSLNLRLRKG